MNLTGEIESMSDVEALEYVKWVERERARLDALRVRVLARFASLRPAEYVADELVAELRWTPRFAANQVADAVELTEMLPATVDALAAGSIDWVRATTILKYTKVLDAEARARVEAAILPYAATRTVKLTREKLAREVAKADPDGAEERHQQRVADSTVECWAEEDGMATMQVYGPAEIVRPIFDVFDQCARGAKAAGARKRLGPLRLDALAGIALGGQLQNRVTELRVTVPASTLAGESTAPGELHGYGPITNDVLRKLADSGNVFWRRILTDPRTGQVLDVGARRRHTAAIGEFIRTRDRWCVFPGCGRPAESCQIDHSEDYATGGATSVTNLGAMCAHHNLMKLDGDWTLEQPKPGYFVWTSPTGTTFTVKPEPFAT
jgi:uncharacterized protein DUF222